MSDASPQDAGDRLLVYDSIGADVVLVEAYDPKTGRPVLRCEARAALVDRGLIEALEELLTRHYGPPAGLRLVR